MKKIISLITAFCFLFSTFGVDIVCAAQSISSSGSGDFSDIEKINGIIPSGLGKVVNSYNFPQSKYTVINIQDIHCHPGVQKNIGGIIENIEKQYEISAIFVEGGYGKIDGGVFNKISDESLRNEIMESMLAQGALTGTEYYLLKNKAKIPFYGLEDKRIHKENAARLAEIIGRKDYYNAELAKIKNEIDYLKLKYFSRENKKFNDMLDSYKAGDIKTERYYSLLHKYINKINNDSEKYNPFLYISLDRYPAVKLYGELINRSKKIDYNKASYEMKLVIDRLKEKLPYAKYSELSLQTGGFTDFEELSLKLKELFPIYGIHVNEKSDFAKLSEYVADSKKINPVELIDEERRLIEDIRGALSNGGTETEIAYLNDYYAYLQDLLNIRIKSDDYRYFKSEYGKFREIYSKYAYKDIPEELENGIRFIFLYYDVNNDRNEIFINNIDRYAGEGRGGNKVVIAVTGGYHSDGLNVILKNNNISHVIIMPSVAGGIKESVKNYERSVLLNKTFASQSFALALATQAADKDVALMMIYAALANLKGSAYDGKNMAALADNISQALGLKADFQYHPDSASVILGPGHVIKIIGKNGKVSDITLHNGGYTVSTAGETGRNDVLRAAFSAISSGGDWFSMLLYPNTEKISAEIMKYAAKNNIIAGDDLIYDIEMDETLPEIIGGVDKEILRKMKAWSQSGILRSHERKQLLTAEENIFVNIVASAYCALGLNNAALDIILPSKPASEDVFAGLKTSPVLNGTLENDFKVLRDSIENSGNDSSLRTGISNVARETGYDIPQDIKFIRADGGFLNFPEAFMRRLFVLDGQKYYFVSDSGYENEIRNFVSGSGKDGKAQELSAVSVARFFLERRSAQMKDIHESIKGRKEQQRDIKNDVLYWFGRLEGKDNAIADNMALLSQKELAAVFSQEEINYYLPIIRNRDNWGKLTELINDRSIDIKFRLFAASYLCGNLDEKSLSVLSEDFEKIKGRIKIKGSYDYRAALVGSNLSKIASGELSYLTKAYMLNGTDFSKESLRFWNTVMWTINHLGDFNSKDYDRKREYNLYKLLTSFDGTAGNFFNFDFIAESLAGVRNNLIFNRPQISEDESEKDDGQQRASDIYRTAMLFVDNEIADNLDAFDEEKLKTIFSDEELKYLTVLKNRNNIEFLADIVKNQNENLKIRLNALMYAAANESFDGYKELETLVAEEFRRESAAGRIKINNDFDLRAVLAGHHIIMQQDAAIYFGEENALSDKHIRDIYKEISGASILNHNEPFRGVANDSLEFSDTGYSTVVHELAHRYFKKIIGRNAGESFDLVLNEFFAFAFPGIVYNFTTDLHSYTYDDIVFKLNTRMIFGEHTTAMEILSLICRSFEESAYPLSGPWIGSAMRAVLRYMKSERSFVTSDLDDANALRKIVKEHARIIAQQSKSGLTEEEILQIYEKVSKESRSSKKIKTIKKETASVGTPRIISVYELEGNDLLWLFKGEDGYFLQLKSGTTALKKGQEKILSVQETDEETGEPVKREKVKISVKEDGTLEISELMGEPLVAQYSDLAKDPTRITALQHALSRAVQDAINSVNFYEKSKEISEIIEAAYGIHSVRLTPADILDALRGTEAGDDGAGITVSQDTGRLTLKKTAEKIKYFKPGSVLYELDVAVREVFDSSLNSAKKFAEMHYEEGELNDDVRNTKEYKARIAGAKAIRAAALLGAVSAGVASFFTIGLASPVLLAAAVIISAPLAGIAANILVHFSYNTAINILAKFKVIGIGAKLTLGRRTVTAKYMFDGGNRRYVLNMPDGYYHLDSSGNESIKILKENGFYYLSYIKDGNEERTPVGKEFISLFKVFGPRYQSHIPDLYMAFENGQLIIENRSEDPKRSFNISSDDKSKFEIVSSEAKLQKEEKVNPGEILEMIKSNMPAMYYHILFSFTSAEQRTRENILSKRLLERYMRNPKVSKEAKDLFAAFKNDASGNDEFLNRLKGDYPEAYYDIIKEFADPDSDSEEKLLERIQDAYETGHANILKELLRVTERLKGGGWMLGMLNEKLLEIISAPSEHFFGEKSGALIYNVGDLPIIISSEDSGRGIKRAIVTGDFVRNLLAGQNVKIRTNAISVDSDDVAKKIHSKYVPASLSDLSEDIFVIEYGNGRIFSVSGLRYNTEQPDGFRRNGRGDSVKFVRDRNDITVEADSGYFSSQTKADLNGLAFESEIEYFPGRKEMLEWRYLENIEKYGESRTYDKKFLELLAKGAGKNIILTAFASELPDMSGVPVYDVDRFLMRKFGLDESGANFSDEMKEKLSVLLGLRGSSTVSEIAAALNYVVSSTEEISPVSGAKIRVDITIGDILKTMFDYDYQIQDAQKDQDGFVRIAYKNDAERIKAFLFVAGFMKNNVEGFSSGMTLQHQYEEKDIKIHFFPNAKRITRLLELAGAANDDSARKAVSQASVEQAMHFISEKTYARFVPENSPVRFFSERKYGKKVIFEYGRDVNGNRVSNLQNYFIAQISESGNMFLVYKTTDGLSLILVNGQEINNNLRVAGFFPETEGKEVFMYITGDEGREWINSINLRAAELMKVDTRYADRKSINEALFIILLMKNRFDALFESAVYDNEYINSVVFQLLSRDTLRSIEYLLFASNSADKKTKLSELLALADSADLSNIAIGNFKNAAHAAEVIDFLKDEDIMSVLDSGNSNKISAELFKLKEKDEEKFARLIEVFRTYYELRKKDVEAQHKYAGIHLSFLEKRIGLRAPQDISPIAAKERSGLKRPPERSAKAEEMPDINKGIRDPRFIPGTPKFHPYKMTIPEVQQRVEELNLKGFVKYAYIAAAEFSRLMLLTPKRFAGLHRKEERESVRRAAFVTQAVSYSLGVLVSFPVVIATGAFVMPLFAGLAAASAASMIIHGVYNYIVDKIIEKNIKDFTLKNTDALSLEEDKYYGENIPDTSYIEYLNEDLAFIEDSLPEITELLANPAYFRDGYDLKEAYTGYFETIFTAVNYADDPALRKRWFEVFLQIYKYVPSERMKSCFSQDAVSREMDNHDETSGRLYYEIAEFYLFDGLTEISYADDTFHDRINNVIMYNIDSMIGLLFLFAEHAGVEEESLFEDFVMKEKYGSVAAQIMLGNYSSHFHTDYQKFIGKFYGKKRAAEIMSAFRNAENINDFIEEIKDEKNSKQLVYMFMAMIDPRELYSFLIYPNNTLEYRLMALSIISSLPVDKSMLYSYIHENGRYMAAINDLKSGDSAKLKQLLSERFNAINKDGKEIVDDVLLEELYEEAAQKLPEIFGGRDIKADKNYLLPGEIDVNSALLAVYIAKEKEENAIELMRRVPHSVCDNGKINFFTSIDNILSAPAPLSKNSHDYFVGLAGIISDNQVTTMEIISKLALNKEDGPDFLNIFSVKNAEKLLTDSVKIRGTNIFYGILIPAYASVKAMAAAIISGIFFSKGKNIITAITMNYRFIKEQLTLKEAAKYAIEKKGEDLVVPVLVINETPGNPKEFGFINSGVKVPGTGKSIWISSRSDAFVVFSKDGDLKKIEAAMIQENARLQKELSAMIRKKMNISLNSKNISVDWINTVIDEESSEAYVEYGEDGTVITGIPSGADLKSEYSSYITGARDVRNADINASAHSIYYFLDNISGADDLILCLRDIENVGNNGQIVMNYEDLTANLTPGQIKAFLAAARRSGVKIVANVLGEKIDAKTLIAAGFDGYLYSKADAMYIHDFVLASDSRANFVDNFSNAATLIERLQKTGGIKVIKNSDIARVLSKDGRSLLDKSNFIQVLKGFKILGALRGDMNSEEFIEEAAYSLKTGVPSELKKYDAQAIVNIAQNGTLSDILRFMNIDKKDSAYAYLNKIKKSVKDPAKAQQLQIKFLQTLARRALVSQNVAGELVNKELEKTLGKALAAKASEPGKDGISDTVKITYDEFKSAHAKEDLQDALLAEIKILADAAFTNHDKEALNAIIELIPAIADVRFEIKLNRKNTAAFDVRQMKSILSSA